MIGPWGTSQTNQSYQRLPRGVLVNYYGGGGKLIEFLVNTGTTYLVLNFKQCLFFLRIITITGVLGKMTQTSSPQLLEYQLGEGGLNHSFLYVPECPTPVLGWDLMTKLNIRVIYVHQEN